MVCICLDSMVVFVCDMWAHLLCGSNVRVSVIHENVLVPCHRDVPCQADFCMRRLAFLEHNGDEKLYWARVSLMPCDGQLFAS